MPTIIPSNTPIPIRKRGRPPKLHENEQSKASVEPSSEPQTDPKPTSVPVVQQITEDQLKILMLKLDAVKNDTDFAVQALKTLTEQINKVSKRLGV